MDICIIGYGYLGCHIARVFNKAGYGVWAIKRQRLNADATPVKLITADLASEELPRLPLERPLAAIFYCVSPDGPSEQAYAEAYQHNLLKALAWANAAPSPVPFILTSSTGIYNQSAGEVVREHMPVSLDSGIRRILGDGESYVKEWAPAHYILRLAGIYGPDRLRMFQVLAHADPQLASDQDYLASPLNLVHAEDIARLGRHLVESKASFGIYNAVDSEPCPRLQIREWLLTHYPELLQEVAPSQRPRPLRGLRYCSNAKALATGFQLAYPDFRAGLTAILTSPSRKES